MNGYYTYAEIYSSGNTISDASPPCPHIPRFCIATEKSDLTTERLTDEDSSGSSSDKDDGIPKRQFQAKSSRLVIRLVVAKPSIPPKSPDSDEEEEKVKGRRNTDQPDKPLDIFSMLPNFTFVLTVLSPKDQGGKFVCLVLMQSYSYIHLFI